MNYSELMKVDEEFNRLEKFVGSRLKDMRNPIMYKQRSLQKGLKYRFNDLFIKLSKGVSFDDIYSELNTLRLSNINEEK